ncbi:hypothetical protein ECANGB1_2316 [Enterospora canceri]|uniref:MRG domain-containing protein n=1 Tax=Enterospora canceri TaxID=1081671 RepID=A0A1Y1S4R6_9MICR|nr:hypothetical protein ECANGB1_2316 [Enterospora canceri]
MTNAKSDPQHKPLPVNRYVIFRTNNAFYEGRIVDVLFDGQKTLYSVISFATFEYFRVTDCELVTQSSLESKRKYRPSSDCGNFNVVRMPNVLKNRLRADKDSCMVSYYNSTSRKHPVKISVRRIIQEFMQFFQQNSLCYDSNEAQEIMNGFHQLFNTFLPMTLLYEQEKRFLMEKDNLAMKEDYTGDFGPIHLLRMLYFVQRYNAKFNPRECVQLVTSDYTVYLIDFLNYKYQDYFM